VRSRPTGYCEGVETIKALLGRVDRWQQHHRIAGVVWAVNKKYGDDRGGYLSALIAYYGFISIFPLMLAAFSIAAWVLPGHSGAINSIYSHLGSFPVLGPSVKALETKHLSGSVFAVVIGVAGLVWGATGLAKTLQHSMDEAWNVPGRSRINFVKKLVVSLEWFAVFALGIIVSTAMTSLSSVFNWGPVGPVLAALPALAVNVVVYLVSFKIFTHKERTWRQLLPGAVIGGLAWTILTGVGIGLLTHDVNHASALYGTFGTTIGFIGFIYLIARLSMYGVELNVVLDRHLWPRTMTSPPLSAADRQQLVDLARREERSKQETVRVEF
jgi:YihY family inner membrane protein